MEVSAETFILILRIECTSNYACYQFIYVPEGWLEIDWGTWQRA